MISIEDKLIRISGSAAIANVGQVNASHRPLKLELHIHSSYSIECTSRDSTVLLITTGRNRRSRLRCLLDAGSKCRVTNLSRYYYIEELVFPCRDSSFSIEGGFAQVIKT